jgi:hypothetical protein
MYKYLIIMALLFSACSSNKGQLNAHGMNVKVLGKKSRKCDVVGKVKGINEEGSVELARNDARNLVGDKGGNAVFFNEEVNNGQNWHVMATGYRCK